MRHRRYSFNSMTPEQSARHSARQKARWEAQDTQRSAWRLAGDPAEDHSEVQLEEAIKLYEHAQKLWEMLGDCPHEARCAQHAADACRVTLAAKRAGDAIKRATGSDQ